MKGIDGARAGKQREWEIEKVKEKVIEIQRQREIQSKTEGKRERQRNMLNTFMLSSLQ